METQNSLGLEHGHFRTIFFLAVLAEQEAIVAKYTLEDVTKAHPVGSKVSIKAGRKDPSNTVVEVKGVREAGVVGTKGHSIWIDTVQKLEGGKEITRSIRPGSVAVA